jgi:acetyl esterase/lipase
MKKIFLFSAMFFSIQCFAQNEFDYFAKAEKFFTAKNYKEAASNYSAGIALQGKNANIDAVLRGAAAFAAANNIDSAFYLINLLFKSAEVSPGDISFISGLTEFQNVRKDNRWEAIKESLLKKASANFPMEEIIYGRKDGLALTMLQLKPKGKSNGKAIIRVIAGSWFSSYRNAEYSIRPSNMYLEKGYTCFLVIVGSQPRYPIPSQIDDIKRAIRFIKFNAAKYSINPNKLGIEGSSAGGHLSLAVATADDKINENAADQIDRLSARVQAVAVLFPPTDVLNWGGPGVNFVNMPSILYTNKIYGALDFKKLDESTMALIPISDSDLRNKIAKEISPIYAVSADDPPTFIIHGTDDLTVPIQQSISFIAKLKEVGVPNQFITKKGGGHNANDMQPELQKFVDWFDLYLK